MTRFVIPLSGFIDNGLQLTSKYFWVVFEELRVEPLTNANYHPQTSWEVRKFNARSISRLCHYTTEHQQDWESYIVLPTYADNTQVHRNTKLPPFNIVLTQNPSGSLTLKTSSMPLDIEHIDSTMALQINLIRRAAELKRIADNNSREARRKRKWDREKTGLNQHLPQETMSLPNDHH